MISILILTHLLLLNICSSNFTKSCQATPPWKLNLCQVECQKCGLNSLCDKCPDYFDLKANKCVPDVLAIYQLNYFSSFSLLDKNINRILSSFLISNQNMSIQNVTTLCKADVYKFDMLGFFNQNQSLIYSFSFPTQVTSIRIKFYFLSLLKNTKVQVVFNNLQVYQNTFIGQNINISQQQNGYIYIPSLSQTSALNMIKQIDTGYIELDSKDYKKKLTFQLQINYKDDPNSMIQFWAFSDLSIVAKRCQDCLSEHLQSLSKNIGIAIGIVASALLILISILFICVKLQQKKRFNVARQKYISQIIENQNQNSFNQLQNSKENVNIRQTAIQNQSHSKKKRN